MKKSFIISSSLFFLSCLIGLSFSCTKPTEPVTVLPSQNNWPVFEGCEWAIQHGDAQSTGHSTTSIISGLELESTIYDSLLISFTSPIFAKNGNILATSEWRGLLILDKSGNRLREIFPPNLVSAPVATSDGRIIVVGNSMIVCFSDSGDMVFTYPAGNTHGCYGCVALGPTGDIFFASLGKLFALDRKGQLLWEINDPVFYTPFRDHIVISIDGGTLFVSGSAFTAIEALTGRILWKFGVQFEEWRMVDSKGNVFLSSSTDQTGNNNPGIYRITPEGKAAYIARVSRSAKHLNGPCSDSRQNLYFSIGDSLVSYDENLNLRWVLRDRAFSFNSASLVSDAADNIFMVSQEVPDRFEVIKLSTEGYIVQRLPLAGNSGATPAIAYNRLYVPTGKGNKIYIIK